jgi:hypothetical protein
LINFIWSLSWLAGPRSFHHRTNNWALLCLAPIGARKALNCKSWLKLERPSHKSMGSYQLQGSSKPKWLGPSGIREVGDDKHVCFIITWCLPQVKHVEGTRVFCFLSLLGKSQARICYLTASQPQLVKSSKLQEGWICLAFFFFKKITVLFRKFLTPPIFSLVGLVWQRTEQNRVVKISKKWWCDIK